MLVLKESKDEANEKEGIQVTMLSPLNTTHGGTTSSSSVPHPEFFSVA